jgi:hypothetical protein
MTKYSGRTLAVDVNGTPAGQMTSLAAFGSSRNLIDASVYGEEWTDFVTGLQDGDEVAAVFARDPADTGQDALVTAYTDTSDTPIALTVTHEGSGESFTVTCLITALAYDSPLDGLYALNTTLKIVNPGVVPGS